LNDDFMLESVEPVATLLSRTLPLLTVLHGETLAVAVPNHVYLVNGALKVFADLTGAFVPLALSRDEAGLCLVVQTGEEQSLWFLTEKGERLVDVRLEAGSLPLMPPVIGYDGRMFAVSTGSVTAVDPDGRLAWRRSLEATPGGAVVTPDGTLVLSAGRDLLAIDEKGETTTLFRFEDDLVTPPVLSDRGEILVASARKLFCLKPD
jgi:hypothetical protein